MITQPTNTQMLKIRKNETLASLFHRAHLPSTLWISVLKPQTASHYLEHLQPDHAVSITTTLNNQFLSMTYEIDVAHTLTVEKQNNRYVAYVKQQPITKTTQFKSSVIHHSLAQAEKTSGLPLGLQHQLEKILSSSLARIHSGDRLNVLYHEYFVDGQKAHPGDIVAAEITNGKQDYRVVRFTENHQTNYYTGNGSGTKPSMIKIPLHYRRIGSIFTYHRIDPFLHVDRPHLGVDFDAPTGTPVKALGNGIVTFCNQMHCYGNVVMIRYNKTYKSLYAHLEKFAAHLHPNEVVKEGQVVGYVGATGWATGPHLHFSLYKNGVAINPLTVKFPNSSPVPSRYRNAFFSKENEWFNEMKLFEGATQTAQNASQKVVR